MKHKASDNRKFCVLCGATEDATPTECPGYVMDQGTKNAVAKGYVDFINGKWVVTEKAKETEK